MKRINVDLHIEELVLHGFAPADGYGVREAIERELGRLLSERGITGSLTKSLKVGRINAGGSRMPLGGKPETIGHQVARQLQQGLAKLPSKGNP